jgi:ketosteroid isomerase-like protein
MNDAVKQLIKMFHFGEPGEFDAIGSSGGDAGAFDHIHPDIVFSAYDIHGVRRHDAGLDAFKKFVAECDAAVSERRDEIISIDGAGDEMGIVRARAFRRSAASGETCEYEWVMAFRIENGLVTVAADMLDRAAADFWGRILKP